MWKCVENTVKGAGDHEEGRVVQQQKSKTSNFCCSEVAKAVTLTQDENWFTTYEHLLLTKEMQYLWTMYNKEPWKLFSEVTYIKPALFFASQFWLAGNVQLEYNLISNAYLYLESWLHLDT